MNIKKLHHIAIAVTDIESSVNYYKKLLGCTEGLHFFSSNGVSEIKYLDGEGYALELTSRGSKMSAAERRETESRFKHIAFETDYIDDLRKDFELKELNPSELKSKKLDSCEIFYFFVQDPDGNEIEFVSYQK
jgi:glyoxylase I family protein